MRAGLRTLQFDPNKGFALNGQWMKVKGVCLHHDAGALGAVVPRDVWKRRLENLKKIGVNAIRMSHNPQAPAYGSRRIPPSSVEDSISQIRGKIQTNSDLAGKCVRTGIRCVTLSEAGGLSSPHCSSN